MGLYPIDCPECKKPFMWFSGLKDQRCHECCGIIEDGDIIHPMEPVDFDDVIKRVEDDQKDKK